MRVVAIALCLLPAAGCVSEARYDALASERAAQARALEVRTADLAAAQRRAERAEARATAAEAEVGLLKEELSGRRLAESREPPAAAPLPAAAPAAPRAERLMAFDAEALFARGSALLRPEAAPILDKLALELAAPARADRAVAVEAAGADARERGLAGERALAVVQALDQRGVGARRLLARAKPGRAGALEIVLRAAEERRR
jgi:outer membrane protein OmpA-like peptidoglycan-associated protein